ncbi:aldo/keto reductase, partial [Candidatus Latescibacterota bacterium]
HAIDRGVNYVDTAYPYHGGNSEIAVGRALGDGYRDRVKLATKSPVWFITKPGDFDTSLDEQLKKMATDHIDCYLLHGLGRNTWQNIVLKHNLIKKAEDAKRDGKILHIGFSFHDVYDAFVEIIDGYENWDFCQIQYNYMDVSNQAGTKGLRYAASKGLAVVIMGPLLGGKLAKATRAVQALLNDFPVKRSPADWALQWVWNQPEVSVVLSGMSAMEQVEENLASAEKARVNYLSAEELALIEQVRSTYEAVTKISCTKCSYCMPCPQGVDIPRNFDLYNSAFMYEDMDAARHMYSRTGKLFGEKMLASSCIQCRECEEKCPQKIEISECMKVVHEELSK